MITLDLTLTRRCARLIKPLKRNETGLENGVGFESGGWRYTHQADRHDQCILKMIGFFADETDFIRIRETVLDCMSDQRVLREQNRPAQEQSECFDRKISTVESQDLEMS